MGVDAVPQVVATDAVVVLVSEKPAGAGSGGDRVVLVALPAHDANEVAGSDAGVNRSPSPFTEGVTGVARPQWRRGRGRHVTVFDHVHDHVGQLVGRRSGLDGSGGWGRLSVGRTHREHQSACEDPRYCRQHAPHRNVTHDAQS